MRAANDPTKRYFKSLACGRAAIDLVMLINGSDVPKHVAFSLWAPFASRSMLTRSLSKLAIAGNCNCA
jgi:hypothetical protein